jgi:hypothetical protein
LRFKDKMFFFFKRVLSFRMSDPRQTDRQRPPETESRLQCFFFQSSSCLLTGKKPHALTASLSKLECS